MKTLIMGLGNPILTDDAVGIRVVEELGRLHPLPDVLFMPADVDGFQLVEVMAGYDRVVVIDAVCTRTAPVGEVIPLSLEELEYSVHPGSPHTLNLATAITWARKLEHAVPGEIILFGIEAHETDTFGEELTREMKERFPRICDELALRLEKLGVLPPSGGEPRP